MRDRTAFKVGLVSFVLAMAIAALLIWKSGLFIKATGFPLVGKFQNIGGLLMGAEVRYRGYKVGKVFKVDPHRDTILVYFWVKNGLEITKGSKLRVVFDGLVGEKYLAIKPNEVDPTLVKSGDVLEGYASPGLADFVEVGTKNLDHTEQILSKFEGILTSDEVLKSVKNTFLSFGQISTQLDVLLKKLNEVSNVVDIQETLTNFKKTSQSLSIMVERLNTTVGNDETIRNLNKIIVNLAQFSEGLKELAPETPTSAMRTKSSSGPVKWIKSVTTMKLRPGAEFLYSPSEKNASYLAQVDLDFHDSFVRIGVGDRYGSTQLLNIQEGIKVTKKLSTRIGLVNTKPGIGMDYAVFPGVKLSADVFDINKPQVDFSGRFKLATHVDAILTLRRDPIDTSAYTNLGFGISYYPE